MTIATETRPTKPPPQPNLGVLLSRFEILLEISSSSEQVTIVDPERVTRLDDLTEEEKIHLLQEYVTREPSLAPLLKPKFENLQREANNLIDTYNNAQLDLAVKNHAAAWQELGKTRQDLETAKNDFVGQLDREYEEAATMLTHAEAAEQNPFAFYTAQDRNIRYLTAVLTKLEDQAVTDKDLTIMFERPEENIFENLQEKNVFRSLNEMLEEDRAALPKVADLYLLDNTISRKQEYIRRATIELDKAKKLRISVKKNGIDAQRTLARKQKARDQGKSLANTLTDQAMRKQSPDGVVFLSPQLLERFSDNLALTGVFSEKLKEFAEKQIKALDTGQLREHWKTVTNKHLQKVSTQYGTRLPQTQAAPQPTTQSPSLQDVVFPPPSFFNKGTADVHQAVESTA